MAKPKLTPWFDGRNQKPWEPGVYQQMSGIETMIGYQYWDGRKWYGWCETIDGAVAYYRRRETAYATYQNCDWRGLASPPDKAIARTERRRG